jgi:hypothetical protein
MSFGISSSLISIVSKKLTISAILRPPKIPPKILLIIPSANTLVILLAKIPTNFTITIVAINRIEKAKIGLTC